MQKHAKSSDAPLGQIGTSEAGLIETINDQLKNISQIEHTRHRSVSGFMVNLVAGLIAYSYRPKKPSLGLRRDPNLAMLSAC
jgi:hypothetical protein